MWRFVRAPLDDYLAALERALPGLTVGRALAGVAAALVAWVVYVPFHELAHAYGCIVTGGTVTRLEIDPMYGAHWLAEIFPFVTVGSDYAGQLTGFDTKGSDLVYLATDFAPFLMTVLIGVPLLHTAARMRAPLAAMTALGAAIPIAYAPFISLPGDFYEMGSILVSRLAAEAAGLPLERWRSDDVVLLIQQLRGADGGALDWLAIAAGCAVGALLALATYGAGRLAATALQTLFTPAAPINGAGTSE